jgi:hypothetical protein
MNDLRNNPVFNNIDRALRRTLQPEIRNHAKNCRSDCPIFVILRFRTNSQDGKFLIANDKRASDVAIRRSRLVPSPRYFAHSIELLKDDQGSAGRISGDLSRCSSYRCH